MTANSLATEMSTMTASDLLQLPPGKAAFFITQFIQAGKNPMDLLCRSDTVPVETLTDEEMGRYIALWREAAEDLAEQVEALRLYERVKRAGITRVITNLED